MLKCSLRNISGELWSIGFRFPIGCSALACLRWVGTNANHGRGIWAFRSTGTRAIKCHHGREGRRGRAHDADFRRSGKLKVGVGPVRTGVTAVLPRGKDSNDPVLRRMVYVNGNGEMTGHDLA